MDNKMVLTISTKKIGSDVTVKLPYTIREWDLMTVDQQNEIINEYVWENIDISVTYNPNIRG